MRCLLKVTLPVAEANAAAKAGKLGSTIQTIIEEMKPEAAYFTDDDGKRAGYIIFDLKSASQIPSIAEPWMQAFNASIELHPVMVAEDLAKAGPAIDKAVKKYGR
jgi:hypothetical protein